jgi:hypothetical protein
MLNVLIQYSSLAVYIVSVTVYSISYFNPDGASGFCGYIVAINISSLTGLYFHRYPNPCATRFTIEEMQPI